MLVIFEVDYIILCTVTSVFIAEAVEKHKLRYECDKI